MLQAFNAIVRAKVRRNWLALGVVPIVASIQTVFHFEKEREEGMFETVEEFLERRRAHEPPPPEMISLGPGFDDCIRVETRLPAPDLPRSPDIVCDPRDKVAFGCHIAAHGGFLAVGAHSDNSQGLDRGAVYIYRRAVDERDGGVDWVLKTRVLADELIKPAALAVTSRNTKFGRKVALADGVLAVMQGSQYDGGPPEWDPEAVYVFGSEDGWTTPKQEAKLPNPQRGSGHGLAIAFLDSETLLVAAPRAAPAHEGAPRGAVYVYERNAETDQGRSWTKCKYVLSPPPGSRGDLTFGNALAADGDLVAVGMIGDRAGSRRGPWRVLLFKRDESEFSDGRLKFLGDVEAPPLANQTFGGSIALKGDVLVISQRDVPEFEPPEGGLRRVWVYRAQGGFPARADWRLAGSLEIPGHWHHGWQGTSIAIGSDKIAIGLDTAGADGQSIGGVFLYEISGISGQTFGRALVSSPAYAELGFGQAVAMLGDTVFIAAESDPHPFPAHGSVFVWEP